MNAQNQIVSGSVGGEVPVVDDVLSSHEQQIYPTTSLDENSIEFEFHLRRKNADVPDIYFTLLGAADISLGIVLNQNAKAKERGNWIPFKI